MPTPAPTSYGKARRQRRPSVTPYSRPPSAARGLRPLAAPDRGTWISKLVNPASRIIGWSASRLFSSVFRKRLAAPPEENHLSNQEVNAASHAKPLMEVGEQGGNDAENKRNNSNFDGAKQKGSYDTDGIVELEQLLKQKTFTRDEFNRLSELVRTRTVEPITLQPAVFCEKKEDATVVMQEKGIRCNGSDRAISSSSLKSPIAEEELGSVEELSTPYMGSMCSKEPSSALSLRNQIFTKDTNLRCNAPHEKGSNHPRTPRSVHFSGIPEVPENGHLTSRPVGRSAMHRMSCSPYFKSSALTSNRVGELHRDSNAGPSASSQLMLTNFMQSNDKQIHKRGSSVLDEDFGSSGPIRRIRRKSNLMSPSKDIRSLHPESVVPTPSSPMSEDIGRWLDVSIQNPRYLDRPEDESRNVRQEENGDAKDPFRSSLSPPDSSKLGSKTVEQLDKLVTSPMVNSSISRSIARDESPSGLTVNMLNEQALKSMKDIDSANFFALPGSENQNAPNVPDAPSLKTSKSQNLHRVEANIPSKPVLSGVKVTHGTNGTVPVISTADVDPGMRTNSLAISGSAKVPLPEKPAFQMAAPEDFWDFDDDDNTTGDTPDTVSVVNDKVEQKKLEGKNKTSETETFEKSAASSSGSLPTSGSLLEADMKASSSPVPGKDTNSLFHASPAPITSSQSPQTPMVPFPLFDLPSSQNDQIAAPGFVAGSKEFHTPVPITATISDLANRKSNESTVSTTALPGLNDTNSSKVGDILGSSEDAASPIVSTSTSPLVTALGTSAFPKLSNGSFTSALSTSSVSPTAGVSTGAPISISTSMRESKSTGLEGSTVKAYPFGTSVIFSGSSAMLNTSSNSAALATSVSSSTSNILPSATTSLSSSLGSSTSAFLMAPAGLQPANGTFGFSASSPPSEPTAVAFGTTAGSTFGTEATQAGKQTSEGSSDKASQFGSFASSPAFGLAGFSSSGSDSSQLRSADLKPFGSSIATSSSPQTSTLPVFGSSTAAPSTGFSFGQSSATSNSQPPASIFGSSISLPSSGFTFGPSAPASTQSSSSSVFGSSSTLPSAGLSFGESAPASTSQFASSVFGSSNSVASAGFKFGQSVPASSQSSSSSVFGSSSTLPSTGLSFGESAPASTSQFSSSVFNSSTSLPPTRFSFGQSAPASSSQPSSSLFGSGASFNSSTSLPPTGFSFGQSAYISSSQPSSSVFGSGTSLSSKGFSSIPASSSQPSSSSVFGSMISPSTGFTFGQPISASSAQLSTPSIFGSSTAANTGFSFGQSASTSGSSSFNFGAASGSTFSFPSAGTTTSAFASPAPSMFGSPAPAAGFSSGFSGRGQINMEDSMADDTTQVAPPMVPTFGQPANSLTTPNFSFGSPANPTGGSSVFQFASQQSPVPQSPSPFQTGGNLEFTGGSFSLGSAGGDKSARKIVKINRNKLRKK